MPACITRENPATAVDRVPVRLTADYVGKGWHEMGLPGYTIRAGTKAVLVQPRYRRSCTSGAWGRNFDGRRSGQIEFTVDGRIRRTPARSVCYERITR